MKSFSSAAGMLQLKSRRQSGRRQVGPWAVRLTTGDQRYSPSQSLVWHKCPTGRPAKIRSCLGLLATGSPYSVLGAGIYGCGLLRGFIKMPEAERETIVAGTVPP